MSTLNRRELIGIIFACLGALGFSSKAIFIKKSYGFQVDAETLLALRMLYSLPFFLLMILWEKHKKSPTREAWSAKTIGVILTLGFFGYYLASYLDFLGLSYISATLERLLLFIYPTFVIVLSRIFLKKRIPILFYPAVLLSYAGVAIVISHESGTTQSSNHLILGSVLVILSALSYAIYLMISGEIVKKIGSMALVAYASCVACFFSVGQFLLLKPVTLLLQPAPVQLLSICIAIFTTVIPIWLLAEAISRLGASLASMIGMLGPVLTLALAAIFLGEPFDMTKSIGASLIIFGIVIASIKPKIRSKE